MNVKITKEQHEYLCTIPYKEYTFGSHLHGIANRESDYDVIRVISDAFYDKFTTLAKYLPNIHSWQRDVNEKEQVIWMTDKQFYHNLFSGDGNMIADVVLLSGEFNDSKFLCRTYKIIKGYLGTGKRDLKLHGNSDKKKFHALRSFYMAETLMDGFIPEVEKIKLLYENYGGCYTPSKETLMDKESRLRIRLNDMLEKGEIDMYPNFKENNELVQVMINCNNIREFKYE